MISALLATETPWACIAPSTPATGSPGDKCGIRKFNVEATQTVRKKSPMRLVIYRKVINNFLVTHILVYSSRGVIFREGKSKDPHPRPLAHRACNGLLLPTVCLSLAGEGSRETLLWRSSPAKLPLFSIPVRPEPSGPGPSRPVLAPYSMREEGWG